MQSFNLDAILYFPWVRFLNKSLAIPHFSVADINKIDVEKIKQSGFKGLVFDKDNTITAPYVNEIYPTVQEAFSQFQSLYRDRIVIVSNSAGTKDDKHNASAHEIENDLGIKVIKHNRKKPGGINAVIHYFNEELNLDCTPNELVMFGDRIFTDIVFGNRYGMLTIHTALLSKERDNKAAAKVREYELPLVKEWVKEGITAPSHERYNPDICLENLI